MKQTWLWSCFGVALIMLLCPTLSIAQSVAFNGDFETGSYSHGWTFHGGNTYTTMASFKINYNVDPSTCLKRRPGAPDNGGIEQEVHLIGGQQYDFSADIAAQYCSS